jgi:hypothetical protein
MVGRVKICQLCVYQMKELIGKKSSRLVKLCVPTVPMEDRLRRMNTETID